MTYPVVEVVWEDHFSSDDWITHDDTSIDGPYYITSVGYLLKETKTKLILVQNVGPTGQLAGTITILKKTIQRRTIVRESAAS